MEPICRLYKGSRQETSRWKEPSQKLNSFFAQVWRRHRSLRGPRTSEVVRGGGTFFLSLHFTPAHQIFSETMRLPSALFGGSRSMPYSDYSILKCTVVGSIICRARACVRGRRFLKIKDQIHASCILGGSDSCLVSTKLSVHSSKKRETTSGGVWRHILSRY